MNGANIPEHPSGDTFNGVIYSIKENNVALNLTGFTAKFRATLINDRDINNVKEIALVAEDLVAGKMKLPKMKIDWAPGVYKYEVTFTYPSGDVKTLIRGNWSIIPKI